MPPRVEHRFYNNIEQKFCAGKSCKDLESGIKGKWKSLDKFSKAERNWDKLKTQCRECINKRSVEIYNNKKNGIVEEKLPKPPKPEKEPGIPGRPNLKINDVIDLLLDYDLCILDDVEDDKLSKAKLHYACSYGHEAKTRLDTIKLWIKEFKQDRRHAVCSECHQERLKFIFLFENENLVEERGFILENMYNNSRGDVIYDIKCKNNHITTGRTKSSFTRGFICRECRETSNVQKCPGCQESLPLDNFFTCNNNKFRNNTDHYCKKCRKNQANERKENGYKFPSKPLKIVDGIEGKNCVTKDCGFKPYSEFWSNSGNQDGLDSHCKNCKGKINAKYTENNRDKIREMQKVYRLNNAEKIKETRKEWKMNNIEKIRKRDREYMKKRRAVDPNYKVLTNLRHRIYLALKGHTKSESTLKLLGCTVEELWEYLESKFEEGMTRENYGLVWHIDHIKPCALFDMLCHRQQRQCFNWRNLQPLFCEYNLSKSDNYNLEQNTDHEMILAEISL